MAPARLGRRDEAEALARKAVGYAALTEFLRFHADALVVLADLLTRAGRPAEATAPLEQAVALHERKDNVVSAGKARAMLEGLSA